MPGDIFDESRREDFFESILNSLTTGIFVTDQDCIIRFINDAYANYLGTRREDIIGRHITEFFPDARAPHVTSTGEPEMGELRTFEGRYKERVIVINRLPFKNDNSVVGMVSQTLFGSRQEFEAVTRRMKYLDQQVARSEQRIKSAFSPRYSLASILGGSRSMQEFREQLVSYARTELPVLIIGATGTGKELAANAIHCESARRDGPFVSINCASVPQELFESELFGYAPGAFSGSRKEGKLGLIELADGGTLFLDEIGDAPMAAQAKLLRVLEERTLYRVGSTQPRTVDFRLVSATNRELRQMAGEGLFREDLYYRISPTVLRMPSLHERKEDIPLLVEHILQHIGKGHLTLTREAIRTLKEHDWPGNVRELRNAVARAAGLCKGTVLDGQLLPPEMTSGEGGPVPVDVPERTGNEGATLAENEQNLIVRTLREFGWNVSRSARKLGISRTSLYEKLRKYGLSRDNRFTPFS